MFFFLVHRMLNFNLQQSSRQILLWHGKISSSFSTILFLLLPNFGFWTSSEYNRLIEFSSKQCPSLANAPFFFLLLLQSNKWSWKMFGLDEKKLVTNMQTHKCRQKCWCSTQRKRHSAKALLPNWKMIYYSKIKKLRNFLRLCVCWSHESEVTFDFTCIKNVNVDALSAEMIMNYKIFQPLRFVICYNFTQWAMDIGRNDGSWLLVQPRKFIIQASKCQSFN